MYFNFGKLWKPIQRITKYSNNDMFNNFNKPAIDYAINNGKTLRFTMDVRTLNQQTYSYQEWQYIQTQYGYKTLEYNKDGFWYAK